ncbi:MAG: rhodanese-like domain-containing protein [Pseudomonadales bacterium]|nr:rhodanese-like domain-containing protein [Pseudomonadales bacterium]
MPITTGYRKLLEAAEAEIATVTPDQAVAWLDDDSVQFVDIRDPRELEREGKIPGAFHAPRGMLEFWVDPESPYFKPVFGEQKRFVFYCQSGWRSALTTQTLQRMGLENACHVGGGFRAWKEAGHPCEAVPAR